MELSFCDVCNESVPVTDLSTGAAVRRKGRVVCVKCESAMSAPGEPALGAESASKMSAAMAATAAAVKTASKTEQATQANDEARVRPSQPVRRGGWMGGVALFFSLSTFAAVGLAGAWAYDRWEQGESSRAQDGQRALRAAELEAARVEGRLAERLGALEQGRSELRSVVTELRAQIEQAARANDGGLDAIRSDLARIDGALGRLDTLPETLGQMRGELSSAALIRAAQDADLRALRDRLQRLELGVVSNPAPLAGAPSDPSSMGAGSSWEPLLLELASENAGTRWEAVQQLGDTRDPLVVPHLAAHVGDSDLFVRMAVARVLGDLGAMTGIPALIEALEDEEPSVREASVVSLRSLSGKDFRYDPTAKLAERNKRIKAWRSWWEKEGSQQDA